MTCPGSRPLSPLSPDHLQLTEIGLLRLLEMEHGQSCEIDRLLLHNLSSSSSPPT